MRLRDRLAFLNRVQQGRLFKTIASGVILVLAVGLAIAIAVSAADAPQLELSPEALTPGPDGAAPEGVETDRQIIEIYNNILSARSSTAGSIVTVFIGAALALGVVWIGLGLTYLALALAVAGVVAASRAFGVWQDATAIVAGVAVLTAAFTTLVRLVTLAFSGAWSITAVARNLLIEAVRMKVSLVFIVMLIFGLAALPGWLENPELRYRVQSFLQYGVGGSFWLIAVLILVFGASTVTFEQRDKTIWQTMTKPVAAWQYLLGKWLGLVTLAAVLLAVSGAGVFMFTEYLRLSRASGEDAAYIAGQGAVMTEDREILETQILTARVARGVDPLELDPEQFSKNIQARIELELQDIPDTADNNAERRARETAIRGRIASDLAKSVQMAYRAIEGASDGGGGVYSEIYSFSGLQGAKDSGRPLIFRYKINAGSNAPDVIYRVTFEFQNSYPEVKEVSLGQFQTIKLLPGVIDENGNVFVRISNGKYDPGAGVWIPNPETINFPPDGLEISYSAGGYRMNFVRVMAVLWIKLAFLAMLAIAASTFVSFPVACLIGFTVFFAAEGAGFLLSALENYATEDDQGKTLIFNTVIAWVAEGIGTAFKVYSDLRPTGRLVEGVRLAWGEVFGGTLVLAVWTALLYGLAVLVFRRRELATYSGHY